jgi:hypothetical protein
MQKSEHHSEVNLLKRSLSSKATEDKTLRELNFPEMDYNRSIFVTDRLIRRVAVLGSVEVIPGADSALELDKAGSR